MRNSIALSLVVAVTCMITFALFAMADRMPVPRPAVPTVLAATSNPPDPIVVDPGTHIPMGMAAAILAAAVTAAWWLGRQVSRFETQIREQAQHLANLSNLISRLPCMRHPVQFIDGKCLPVLDAAIVDHPPIDIPGNHGD
jgi:hypothetical protein